jgi:hypothetical protein
MHNFVPRTYTVTLGPVDYPASALGGGPTLYDSHSIGNDPSFGGGVHPVSTAGPAGTAAAHAAGEQGARGGDGGGGSASTGGAGGAEHPSASEGKGQAAVSDFTFHAPRSPSGAAAVGGSHAVPPLVEARSAEQPPPARAPSHTPDLL